jgi:gp229|uniref:Transferase, nesg, ydcK, Structural Genomics.38A n=2 Tax=unclassified Caudoviricetes TaxID=2788787 RepID=A0A8S5LXQ0_9CAUD|nr:MAG TPA: Putative transferase, nesg, ydcK, Structural Genomics.38A [Siphoviridae sp. ctZPw9]DAF99828.1 MAG TPA: putative transferase, nesg, ydcK, Structural Genomics.38A [Siphoviridae sp. ctPNJ4]
MEPSTYQTDKYELLKDDAITVGNVTLYRIKALKDSKFFKAGDIGGYIEKIENLAMQGDAWVFGDARVYGDG